MSNTPVEVQELVESVKSQYFHLGNAIHKVAFQTTTQNGPNLQHAVRAETLTEMLHETCVNLVRILQPRDPS